jgi:carboxypeptidase Q
LQGKFGIFSLQLRHKMAESATSNQVPERYSKYVATVSKIYEAVPTLSKGYERLEYLCTEFGPRISGSENLERAIDWLDNSMREDGLENVHTEAVTVPRWERNIAYCYIVSPLTPGGAFIGHPHTKQCKHSNHSSNNATNANNEQKATNNGDLSRSRALNVLAIGQSVATPPEGITAPIVQVNNFDELEALLAKDKDAVRGKIVFYNCVFTEYGKTVMYRATGAKRVEEHGAAAVIVRSVGPTSLYTPHTGTSIYSTVPAVCCTIEDAELLARLAKNHAEIILHLFTSCKNFPPAQSRNTIAELKGSEKPEEIVVIGAHIDSWDTGHGAHDDGQGVIVAYEAVRLLKALNLRPRRTIRVVAFTDEEGRSSGARAYFDGHKHELERTVAAMETDVGCFTAIGFAFTGAPEAKEELKQLAALLGPVKASTITDDPDGGVDVEPLIQQGGVPGLLLQLDWGNSF